MSSKLPFRTLIFSKDSLELERKKIALFVRCMAAICRMHMLQFLGLIFIALVGLAKRKMYTSLLAEILWKNNFGTYFPRCFCRTARISRGFLSFIISHQFRLCNIKKNCAFSSRNLNMFFIFWWESGKKKDMRF